MAATSRDELGGLPGDGCEVRKAEGKNDVSCGDCVTGVGLRGEGGLVATAVQMRMRRSRGASPFWAMNQLVYPR